MLKILIFMFFFFKIGESYKIVKVTQYYDDLDRQRPIVFYDEVKRRICSMIFTSSHSKDNGVEIPNISKRNIGSLPRLWRKRVLPGYRSLRSSSSRSVVSPDPNNQKNNIFFRTYRDDEDSNVYVDLRTEALMRGLG